MPRQTGLATLWQMMRKITYVTLALVLLPVLAVTALFLMPQPQFVIEPARPAWWGYPSVTEAHYAYRVREDGKLEIELEHPVLRGITPAMVAWWYRYLPVSSTTIDDVQYPYYQLFHLSEHGRMRILEPATDGTPGMGVGALVYRQERFGPFYSKGQGRVLSYGDDGYVVAPVLGPLVLGRIEHRFRAVSGGTLYTVHAVLGSEAPLIGPILNLYLRTRQFPESMLKQWMRHQVEEVGSLVHYLPQLYRGEKLEGL